MIEFFDSFIEKVKEIVYGRKSDNHNKIRENERKKLLYPTNNELFSKRYSWFNWKNLIWRIYWI